MEDLFSTSLSINGKMVSYRVIFDNEQYVFSSTDNEDAEFKNFSIKRENDEWHEQQQLPDSLRNEAIRALESYLLKQH